MNARRILGLGLTIALLAGQTLVPLTRAACGVPRGAARPACSFCAASGAADRTATAATLAADRSCCAVQKPAADRDPATVTASRAPEPRLEMVAHVATLGAATAVPFVTNARVREAPPPLFDSPHRTTTVLLI